MSDKSEIPNENSLDSDDLNFKKKTSIALRTPIKHDLAEKLVNKLNNDFLDQLKDKFGIIQMIPRYNIKEELESIDFGIELNSQIKEELNKIVTTAYSQVNENGDESDEEKPMTFTDLLGTYRIKVTRIYIPILICIFSATFLAWLAVFPAEVNITSAAVFPEEESIWKILLNGAIPVIMSAIFITVLWILIKKYGIKVFKAIMGIIVIFYTWIGFDFFSQIIVYLIWDYFGRLYTNYYSYLIDFISYGSALILLITGILFFRNKLNTPQKNIIVLLYGIFMGALFGILFPLWSFFTFAIFLSIWDLITVFKGPLGKIADLLKEDQIKAQKKIENQDKSEKTFNKDSKDFNTFSSVQNRNISDEELKINYKDVQVELGSGDLILYSALTASIFKWVMHKQPEFAWFLMIFTIIGILVGLFLTLYLLITKRRMLPALPFSMLFGIGMFFIGELIIWLI